MNGVKWRTLQCGLYLPHPPAVLCPSLPCSFPPRFVPPCLHTGCPPFYFCSLPCAMLRLCACAAVQGLTLGAIPPTPLLLMLVMGPPSHNCRGHDPRGPSLGATPQTPDTRGSGGVEAGRSAQQEKCEARLLQCGAWVCGSGMAGWRGGWRRGCAVQQHFGCLHFSEGKARKRRKW